MTITIRRELPNDIDGLAPGDTIRLTLGPDLTLVVRSMGPERDRPNIRYQLFDGDHNYVVTLAEVAWGRAYPEMLAQVCATARALYL